MSHLERHTQIEPDIRGRLAAPWTETISEPNQRNSMIENVSRQWLNTDPAAAQAWLAKTPLPEDRKQQLLEQFKPH